ncbi:MAG: ATP-binding cassette domain-containing protein [Oscillospiraceae bacterium]|nr:ATP-binding cassette domain-containing protein [Oscillospiraceae bacterium]MBQ8377810.1 ATP-binding cassette domain-containing protein [Oscillospiraceae bacterium]MBQ8884005.1 ATP-binding cassette domain-containing protein [Oscillospiraceae bacterium]
MIEVVNLSKHYGDKKAVDGISFKAESGEILGFLGPNGAGKSTTMNILTGYISSTDGKALIDGIDILEDPIKAKAKIGYLPELPPLYMDMTVKEYLNFIYDLKKCKLPRNTHLQDICKLVKIDNVYKRIIKNLSKGYKQRVGLAQALVGNPPVLILDEPTVGLDPNQIIEIRSLIKKLGKNHTVILSSHILSEVQAVCDRIVVINQGKIVADDTANNLSQSLSNDHRLLVRIDGPKDEVLKLIKTIPGVETVIVNTEIEKGVWEYRIEAGEGNDIRRELFKRLAQRNWYLLSSKSTELSLEDIFLKLTMGEELSKKDKETLKKSKKGDNK